MRIDFEPRHLGGANRVAADSDSFTATFSVNAPVHEPVNV